MLPSFQKFRRHAVYRDWEFERADEDLPTSQIFDTDSSEERDEGERARKKRRIEEHGFNYIKGRPLRIQSARLRGPFESTWNNPWKKESRSTAANAASIAVPTRGPSSVLRVRNTENVTKRPDVHKRQGSSGGRELRPRTLEEGAKAASPNMVTGQELDDDNSVLMIQEPGEGVQHSRTRSRHSSNVSDRTLEWLQHQHKAGVTPVAPAIESSFLVQTTPSKPPRSPRSWKRVVDSKDAAKPHQQQTPAGFRTSPGTIVTKCHDSKSRSVNKGTAPRLATQVSPIRTSASSLGSPIKGFALTKGLATASQINISGDDRLKSKSKLSQSHVLFPDDAGRRSPSPTIREDNTLQTTTTLDQDIEVVKASYVEDLLKRAIPEEISTEENASKVGNGKSTKHKSIENMHPQKSPSPRMKSGFTPINKRQSTNKSPPTKQLMDTTGKSKTTFNSDNVSSLDIRAVSRQVLQQSAARCADITSMTKNKPNHHNSDQMISVHGKRMDEMLPPMAKNRNASFSKHPLHASPSGINQSPGFVYRRISDENLVNVRPAETGDTDAGVPLSEGKRVTKKKKPQPRKRTFESQGADAEPKEPTRGVDARPDLETDYGSIERRPETTERPSMQAEPLDDRIRLAWGKEQAQDRDRAIQSNDALIGAQDGWELIERFTNQEIPVDGKTGALLRKALRTSGASFLTEADEAENDGQEQAEIAPKSTSGNGTNVTESGISIPDHQLSKAPADSDLSTQAALLQAHRAFQADLASPGKQIPSGLGDDADGSQQMQQLAGITPFRELNWQFEASRTTPQDNMSTQAMLDAATDIGFSTIKKRKSKGTKRASFAPSLGEESGAPLPSTATSTGDNSSMLAVNATDKGAGPVRSKPIPLVGFFNFLARPMAETDNNNEGEPSGQAVQNIPGSSDVRMPSWAASATTTATTTGLKATSSSEQPGQRRDDGDENEAAAIDMDGLLDETTSFLEPWSIDTALKGEMEKSRSGDTSGSSHMKGAGVRTTVSLA